MKSTSWKDIAELTGIFAIVASLIFFGIQLRQDRQFAGAQTNVDAASSFIDISELVVNNSDVWVRALDGDELSQVDRLKFEQIALAWLRRRMSQWNLALSLGGKSGSPINAAKTIYQHPGLRRWFETEVGKGPASFFDQVSQELAALDKEAPRSPMERNYAKPLFYTTA